MMIQMKMYTGQGQKGPKCGSFCPCGAVVSTLLRCMCAPTWKLSEPHSLGIFMEALSSRHDGLLAQSLSHLLPGGWQGWG